MANAAPAPRARINPVDESVKQHVAQICREILAPLVRADGGEMYLVSLEGDDVRIHLSGTCAGCPGATLTSDKVILPALRTAAPNVRVVVTTGVKIPEGAQKL
jgi:Fe-S cluster biogenesis protein NfuA